MVRKDKEFEEFDVMREADEAFEEFDVTKEPTEELKPSIESFGGLVEDENELKSVLKARDEAERLFIDPIEKIFEAAEEGPTGFENFVGVGIGEKEIRGVPTGELAIRILVKEKLSDSEVASEALVPESVGGVPTDVEATGEIYANMFIARYRPAPGGVSIGNCNMNMAGTLGCLVTDGRRLFILSNNHVLALLNRGPVGVGIPQPGRLDHGVCPGDIIARLTRWIPIAFNNQCNYVDTAIAQTSPALVDRRIIRLGGVRQNLIAPEVAPTLGMQVQKSGRTTQYTRGVIDLINVTVYVGYPGLASGTARFCNQFRVKAIGRPFSKKGDSGSLVTTYPRNNPVGLLFAGNDVDITFCNDIRRDLNSLGVRIVY